LALVRKLLAWIKTLNKHLEELILVELQAALLLELQVPQQYK
jgi:hypothetical protein